MSVCSSVELVESISGGDILKVVIDDNVEAFWMYNYSDALNYVGKEVAVDYRTDIYKGNMCQFINTFIVPTVVQTVDKKENIKLFCDQEDNQSTVSFNDMLMGETKQGCVVFCISSEYKSSSAAVWQELVIRDKFMRVAKLRIFDYTNVGVEFAGRYVLTELTKSKYGFQSTLITPVDGLTSVNPEITIAKDFIQTYFAGNPEALSFITNNHLISFLEEHIDYEAGYGLVRLAMELSMVESMYNITKDVDLVSIEEALIAYRGYLTRSSVLSHTVNNIIVSTSAKWHDKKKVMLLLDIPQEDEDLPERKVFNSIIETVDTLLSVRKGVKL